MSLWINKNLFKDFGMGSYPYELGNMLNSQVMYDIIRLGKHLFLVEPVPWGTDDQELK